MSLEQFANLSLKESTPQSQMQEFDELCVQLYSNGPNQQKANYWLTKMKEDPQNIHKFQYFLDHSIKVPTQFLAASCIKETITEFWPKLSNKTELKDFLLHFLFNKGTSCEKQVLNMVIMCIAKLTKKGWHDD
jgi:hypothetical protein